MDGGYLCRNSCDGQRTGMLIIVAMLGLKSSQTKK